MKKFYLSSLNHTWLIDIDGTLVIHNGYKMNNKDRILLKSKIFIQSIPKNDYVIFLTSRSEKYKKMTLNFLNKHRLRYDLIVFNLPLGERILINDNKPSGLVTAHALSIKRNHGINSRIIISKDL